MFTRTRHNVTLYMHWPSCKIAVVWANAIPFKRQQNGPTKREWQTGCTTQLISSAGVAYRDFALIIIYGQVCIHVPSIMLQIIGLLWPSIAWSMWRAGEKEISSISIDKIFPRLVQTFSPVDTIRWLVWGLNEKLLRVRFPLEARMSRPAQGTTYSEGKGNFFSPGLRRQWRDTNHAPSSSAEDKNGWK
jgi:hypothetical protein